MDTVVSWRCVEESLCGEGSEEAELLCFPAALSLLTEAAVLGQNNRDGRARMMGVYVGAHIRVDCKAWSHP